MYGKHTDFTGFRVLTEDGAEYMVRLIKPEDGAQDCDFCMDDAVYIVEDVPGADEYRTCAVGYCQPCIVLSANEANFSGDEWRAPVEVRTP